MFGENGKIKDFNLWAIVANLSGIIAIGSLWGFNEQSSVMVKMLVTLGCVIISIFTFDNTIKCYYKVKGYDTDSEDGDGDVNKVFISKRKRIQVDKLVTIIRCEHGINTPIAVGYIVNGLDEDKYTQIDIVYKISDEINRIKKNDEMTQCYFVKGYVRYKELRKLFDKERADDEK